MGAPKKGTCKFQIQLELSVIEELKTIAKADGELSANALAAKINREKIKERQIPASGKASKSSSNISEIDLRELLLEAHRNISELTKTIAAITQERKGGPSESAAKGKG